MRAGLDQHIATDGPIDPRDLADRESVGQQIAVVTDDDPTTGDVDVHHVPLRSTARQTDPPSLADRDHLHRSDLTELFAGGVDDTSGPELDAIAEERLAPTGRRDEAHVLAVGFGGRAEFHLGCEPPNLVLVDVADGEQRACQVGLIEHVHHIALILGLVGATLQRVAARRVTADPGVMAGRHGVEAELIRPTQQPVELHVPVALDARVRGDPGGVLTDIGFDDVGVEIVAEVEHQVVDVELLGHPARIVDIAHGAATGVAVPAPQLHRHTDDVVSLLQQERAGDRRVDAA